jgi:N-acetylmuramic acid 6-phosphate etherase
MVRVGKVHGNLMVDLQVTCRKLQDRGERILQELLGVERREATELLERAGGEVKTAMVMHGLGVEAPAARARLEEVGGVVGRLLGGRSGSSRDGRG